MTADVFETAALRRAVTQAWHASPTRFREDANSEEDHARGYYRGRVVVELAQNAADAAARADVPGRLSLRLVAPSAPGRPWSLHAANTGAPLDAPGVASLGSLRASAKVAAEHDDEPTGPRGPARDPSAGIAPGEGTRGRRAASVGRFGVGFAAVRSVADVVRIGSADRAVEFSVARTRAVLEGLTGAAAPLAQEVAARADRLPALRLPFPARVDVPDGFTTLVELELRDDAAVAEVRAQLADVDDALLLALPALAEVRVDDDLEGVSRRLADVEERWTVVRRTGEVPAALLADRPVEGRDATWAVTWALPAAPGPAAHGVGADDAASHVGARLHAPTPTDEPLSLPALLVATFPLDPSRRHVAPGPLADEVARRAGAAYAELLAAHAPRLGAEVLALVPTGLPAGPVDAAVREAAAEALRATALLPAVAVTDEARLLAPRQARAVVGEVGADARVLAALGVPGLVRVPPHLLAAARSLGTEVIALADLVDDLPLDPDPARWAELYAALEPYVADPGVREALAALPVPLADGRVVRGPRGLVLVDDLGDRPVDDALAPEDLAALGLRVVDARAAHPVLARLGARTADLRALLGDRALRDRVLAVARAADDGEPDESLAPEVAGLLRLVAAVARSSTPAVPELPFWWGELPLRTADAAYAPARGCAVPGSWAADHLSGLDVVAPEVLERWGEPTLRAVGAVVGLAVHRVPDVLTPVDGEVGDPDAAAPEGWLPDWDLYVQHLADTLGQGAYVGELTAVADLDAVADDAWPAVLARVAADPAARAALLAPVRASGGAPGRVAPSYTAWWLREELGGAFAVGPVPFLRPAPGVVAGLDDAVLAALGGVRDLAELPAHEWPDYLDALPAVGTRVPAADALAVWRALAALATDPARSAALADLPADRLPDRLPALDRGRVVVADAEDVLAAPDPQWAQLGPVLPVPAGAAEAVGDLLDLRVAPAAQDAPAPDGVGTPRDVDPAVAAAVPGVPSTWLEHADLRVGGVAVEWWVDADGVHVVSGPGARDGLAQGLAVAAGRFRLRHVVAAGLADAATADAELARSAWDA